LGGTAAIFGYIEVEVGILLTGIFIAFAGILTFVYLLSPYRHQLMHKLHNTFSYLKDDENTVCPQCGNCDTSKEIHGNRTCLICGALWKAPCPKWAAALSILMGILFFIFGAILSRAMAIYPTEAADKIIIIVIISIGVAFFLYGILVLRGKAGKAGKLRIVNKNGSTIPAECPNCSGNRVCKRIYYRSPAKGIIGIIISLFLITFTRPNIDYFVLGDIMKFVILFLLIGFPFFIAKPQRYKCKECKSLFG
jgi:hypothetical protein